MHLNNNLLFYIKSVMLVIFALSTQHWKNSLWHSHEGHMLCTQSAFHPQLPCIQVHANVTSVFSSLLGTHVVWREYYLAAWKRVPKEDRWGWAREYPAAASIRHSDTTNDSNFRDTSFSFLHICQEYRTGKVGKSYMTYAGFIQLPA